MVGSLAEVVIQLGGQETGNETHLIVQECRVILHVCNINITKGANGMRGGSLLSQIGIDRLVSTSHVLATLNLSACTSRGC